MKLTIKQTISLSACILATLPYWAMAAADCKPYPKEDWASEETLKEALEAEGYVIKRFKVDGHCYEIYGRNAQKKKVEIYFDMKTLAIVKAEVEK